MTTSKSVTLGYVHGGTSAAYGIRPEFVTSLLSVVLDEKAGDLVGQVVQASCGALVAVARNMLTAQFLASDSEWLWQVDTDMAFGPQTLLGLHSVANPYHRPIVSALCHILDDRQGVMPSVYQAMADDGDDTGLQFERLKTVPPGRLLRVAAAGAACLLVHRSAFEKIRADQGDQPVWWNHVTSGPVMMGEDLSFCMRAGAAGVPVYVHAGVQAGHVKPVMIGDVTGQ